MSATEEALGDYPLVCEANEEMKGKNNRKRT